MAPLPPEASPTCPRVGLSLDHGCDDALAELLARLERRGLVRDGVSKWGRPVVRYVCGTPGPQRLADASPLQRRLVACAYGTPSPGPDLCASWAEQCFSRLGLGVVLGDAARLCQDYCNHDDLAELKVGMAVAVPAHPFSAAGLRHGHVGLYVGSGVVRDCVREGVRDVPLELWLCAYGLMEEPRWGWLGSMGLC